MPPDSLTKQRLVGYVLGFGCGAFIGGAVAAGIGASAWVVATTVVLGGILGVSTMLQTIRDKK